MVSWLNKLAPTLIQSKKEKVSIPEGIWLKCKKCAETLYSKDFEKNYKVCPICNHHDRLTAHERINYLFDKNSFVETESDLYPTDHFQFVDTKKYKDRIKQAVSKTGQKESVICGIGKINNLTISAAIFDFQFLGGSMGTIAGEKISRATEAALDQKIPLLVISASGGARMQESILSLVQMAKTSATLYQLKKESLPYISLLTDPTTGGVSASFAMLGDINIAEPGALIGFAGPRVIKETIKQDLPEGFQRSEFLLEHGSIDRIVERKNLPHELYQLFTFMTINKKFEHSSQEPST